VTSQGFVVGITEHYSQHGPGFAGDKLVFSGTQTLSRGSRFQRMTYARTDSNHFTRTFEDGAGADGPLTVVSSGTCARVSSAPVPTPPPHP
jgi:hypothetical protein